jgi:hypothetical protein
MTACRLPGHHAFQPGAGLGAVNAARSSVRFDRAFRAAFGH